MVTTSDIIGLSGLVSLYGGVISCIVSVILAAIFLVRQKQYVYRSLSISLRVQVLLMFIAVVSLALLLQTGAFEYTLVFDAVESGMSWVQKLGGLWSAQASSLLFFSFIVTMAVWLTFQIGQRLPDPRMSAAAVLLLNITLIFFLIPPAFWVNPFERYWLLTDGSISTALFSPEGATLVVPTDGKGLNPSLRHPAMLLHPPFLYLGMVGFFIPYALGLVSLLYQPGDEDWMKLSYPTAILSWVCLTLGMFLGSWWAYTIQGWGGYWGWDAVEIAGLLPWLLSFGLLHSMQANLRGRPFKRWTYVFVFLIFIFVLLGIMVTRSGILESVHAYTSGKMGPILSGLLIGHMALVSWLLVKNWRNLKVERSDGRKNRSDQLLTGLNVCWLILVFIYLVGQTMPVTSQWFFGSQITFVEADYEFLSLPFLLLVLLFTALFPLIPSDEKGIPKAVKTILWIISAAGALYLLVRHPLSLFAGLGYGLVFLLFGGWLYLLLKYFKRKNIKEGLHLGTILTHLGLALLAFGILGVENFSSNYEAGLVMGDTLEFGDWSISADESRETVDSNGQSAYELDLTLKKPDGNELNLSPEIKTYPKLDLSYAVPAIYSNLIRDVHVVLTEKEDEQNHLAKLQIAVLPFMSWIWIGGAVMLVGGCLSVRRFY